MNYRLSSVIAAAMAALCLSGAVFAETGVYVGAGLGSASLEDSLDGSRFDDDVESYRLLGGIQLGRAFAFEAGYQNFGDFEQSISVGGETRLATLTADGWTFGGTLSLPLSEFVSLLGRGGVFVWDADVDINGIASALDNDSNPYYGAGAKIGITPNFSLLGDWTRFELDRVETDVFSIGFEYRFGF